MKWLDANYFPSPRKMGAAFDPLDGGDATNKCDAA